jgi:hypothetical protein
LEEAADLIADLEQAFEKAKAANKTNVNQTVNI